MTFSPMITARKITIMKTADMGNPLGRSDADAALATRGPDRKTARV